MNLHGIANAAVAQVNPNLGGVWQRSAGYTTNSAGQQVPAYAVPLNVTLQVQALSTSDLRHVDALNIQGIMRAVYIYGLADTVDRPNAKGGDLLVFGGQTWLITQLLEPWDADGWCKVVVTLQNGS